MIKMGYAVRCRILKGACSCFLVPVLLLAASSCGSSDTQNGYVSLTGAAQGTVYHIVYEPAGSLFKSKENGEKMVRDSVAEFFKRIDKSVSGYDSSSILSKFNANIPVKLDDIFVDNYKLSDRMYDESTGAFDASSAPLFDLWGFGFTGRKKPDSKAIDSIMAFTGMKHFKLVEHKRKNGNIEYSITKDDPRCKLNFNAVAQGYSSDYFAERFRKMGIKNFLIEIGGEIFAEGANPRGKPWRVGVDKPVDGNNSPGEMIQNIIMLSGKALVTSGDYRKYYIEKGKKYSHTINPKTGYPVQHNLLSATVVASSSAIADAYATYFMVVGTQRAKEITEKTEGIEVLLIYGDQNHMREYASPGMKEMMAE